MQLLCLTVGHCRLKIQEITPNLNHINQTNATCYIFVAFLFYVQCVLGPLSICDCKPYKSGNLTLIQRTTNPRTLTVSRAEMLSHYCFQVLSNFVHTPGTLKVLALRHMIFVSLYIHLQKF